MRQKKIFAAAIAAGLCVMTQMTVFAGSVISGTDADGIGPGFGTPAVTEDKKEDFSGTAWKKVNGVYLDDGGNVIEGAILRGVSVSKWQGNVDWAKAAADDVSFALIRMGSFGYEGEYTMDEYFDRNMREAKANGIHTTPYIYLQTKTVEEAREAAQYAVDVAKKYDIVYPIAADIESQSIMDLSVQELTDVTNAFCQVLAENGYTPIVYSDYYKFTHEMDTNQIPYDIWLARYGGDHRYPNRTMWQATDKGRVDGIAGNVCIEFAFKDYAGGQNTGNPQGPGAEGPGGANAGQTAEQAHADGWDNTDGAWYYYENGQMVTGWKEVGGIWYYMDPANGGIMVSDVIMEIDGVSYRFDGSGAMM